MNKHTVLIVEDENIVALDLKRRLEKLGYVVVGMAATADKALNLFTRYQPHVILMDIHIKGSRDGIETARQINELSTVPIIFLTAYADDETLNRARQTHPYGYLLKPYSERDLHTSIQVALERHRADERMRKKEEHFRLALEAARLGTWETEKDVREVILGYTQVGNLEPIRKWGELMQRVLPADCVRIDQAILHLREELGSEVELTFELQHPDSGRRWFSLTGKSFGYPQSGEHKVVGIIQDITDKRQIEEQLQQAAMAFRCSADGIVVLDKKRKVVSVNEAFTRITGYSQEEARGRELDILSVEVFGEDGYEEVWLSVMEEGSWQGEYPCHRQDNRLIHVRVSISAVEDVIDPVGQYVLMLSDLTSMREVQEQLSRVSRYDVLTGLPNRTLFMARLDQALARARQEKQRLGLLFLDIDHFKRINDTMGHRVGDSLLRVVADRLGTALGANDTLYRIGGDEFMLLSEAVRSSAQLEALAQALLKRLQQPLELIDTEIVPSASIGIAMYPQHSRNRDDLIKMADAAMFAAKSMGRNRYAMYQTVMTQSAEQYLSLERALRRTLKEERFQLHYQPQIDAHSGKLVGLEALLRWQHPERGLISAGEIIPVAENSNLIVELGEWVLLEACRQLRCWLDQGIEPIRLAVNVSIRQLQDQGFVHLVDSSIRRYNIPSPLLELEITESCLQECEISLGNLKKLKQLGLTISIDDFGTGYSCMSSLKNLPIHCLKIDQSFVRGLPQDENDMAIASAIIALGHQLKLRIVAEGIEFPAQAEFLRSAGCDVFQGYLLGYPMSAEDVLVLMQPGANNQTMTGAGD